MKRILFINMVLLLLLTVCSAPMQTAAMNEEPTYGIYEFTFSVDRLSGWPFEKWDFVYTYKDEEIQSGYQLLYPLELFTFHIVQVDVIERGNPGNSYRTTLSVAICDGGSGKTEIIVTDSDGKTATFKIICNVTQVGRQ